MLATSQLTSFREWGDARAANGWLGGVAGGHGVAATLWEPRGTARTEAVAAVLGRSRALLLTELESPAATTELARRAGISAAGVSQHLTALRDAGLVTAHRAGRSVLYARTSVADALICPAGA